jgi:hypothetical protein
VPLKNIFKNETFVCTLIAVAMLVYFLSNFTIATSVSDFFYDADTPRTLNYLNNPTFAFSSLRPFLVVVTSIGFLFNIFVTTYLAWCLLNFLGLAALGWSLRKLTNQTISKGQILLMLTANFSALCWFAMPDTFLLAITFFSIAIVIYAEGSQKFRIVLSGIIASSLNLFLLFAWLAAHFWLGRKSPFKTLSTASLVILITGLASASGQILNRETGQSSLPPTLAVQSTDPVTSVFPFYEGDGLLEKFSVLKWIHPPWIGIQENLLSFLSAPWMPSYKYDIANLPSNSERFPVLALILAISLSLLSFYGLFKSRRKFRNCVIFCFSLEITVFILFITYSTHPFLFSPFLLLPRLFGLLVLANGQKAKLYLPLSASFVATILSLYLLN